MMQWITSMDRKVHQRAMNQLVRAVNKHLEKDELWCGRFMIQQVYCPQWHKYEDGSGAELFVHLKFIDRCTGQYYTNAYHVNAWRSGGGWRIWDILNWLITQHWNVWQEELARERNFDAWREYNKTVRRV